MNKIDNLVEEFKTISQPEKLDKFNIQDRIGNAKEQMLPLIYYNY